MEKSGEREKEYVRRKTLLVGFPFLQIPIWNLDIWVWWGFLELIWESANVIHP